MATAMTCGLGLAGESALAAGKPDPEASEQEVVMRGTVLTGAPNGALQVRVRLSGKSLLNRLGRLETLLRWQGHRH